ncbi:hypothetical protein L1I30_07065 [Gillisia sp. M10.2A]|uniref:Viral A-type inclusion protein n=1 Tax=Gillisia lutea TaxID=2909668 RepID=A0ABS9EEX0_9FLAO|nr:hypothetical protein [Gillisia lutea]MCF4101420.1 hypothetical protein [Gillisia lutea]
MTLFKKSWVWLLCCTLFLISCESTSEKKKEYDELFHQVLDIHDEVMPKMVEIPALKKELETIADTSAAAEKYRNAATKLEEGDRLMMDWMHSFSDEFVKGKAELQKMNNQQLQERIDAITAELEDVKLMRDQVNSSIENAKELTE